MTSAAGKLQKHVSPAASGPAGPQFEGQVGAHYLLTLLAGGEPRGLPGTTVNRVAFQAASDGFALDDVAIHASNRLGHPAVLEIQVKRTIDFTPSDTVFRDVVAQVARSASKPEFDSQLYELAVALERTSTKIERVYQEVLQWARHCSSAEIFAAHISRAGQASEAMRQFVETFRANLKLAGASHDNAALWRVLRRFQILVFDFNQPGSASELLARERCAMLLAPQDAMRGGNLWITLSSLATQRAATAGDFDATSLREALAQFAYRWAGDRRLAGARAALDELSAGVLNDIVTDVAGVRIDRATLVTQVDAALESARYVEIRGDAGVGKSGVLKHLAERVGREARVVALSADRTPTGGWTALRSMLGCEVSAREFLADIACDGAAVLFIDGADFFDDDGKRATVRDLIRAAADVPQFSVVVTARRNFGVDEPSWLPSQDVARLASSAPVVIKELAASEIDQLKTVNASLAALMADKHPAHAVVRNLFRLARLVKQTSAAPAPLTEAEMALQWWTGADGDSSGRRERQRLLKSMALHAFTRNAPMDASAVPPAAIEALVHSGSLRELQSDLVGFQHDVLREWAIACVLFEEPARIADLPLSGPAPAGLLRAVELTARLSAERGTDPADWTALVQKLTGPEIHGSWRRTALLALVRSELGEGLLERMSASLLANDGALLADLVRIVIAVDSEPATRVWHQAGFDGSMLPVGWITPTAPSWIRLIIWSLGAKARLPGAVIPDIVDLYNKWGMAFLGKDALTPLLIEQLHTWLVEIETAFHPQNYSDRRQAFGIRPYSDNAHDLESNLRMGFLAFCNTTPKLAESYLRSVIARQSGDQIALDVLKFSTLLAQAAPVALADLALRTFIPEPNDDPDDHRDSRGPFGFTDLDYMPASPAQGPFLELLQRAPAEGIRLVRAIVNHAIKHKTGGRDSGRAVITIPFPDGDRDFPWPQSYMWSRDNQGPYLVSSALMALEYWSHERIEAGQPFDQVLADVLGPTGSPAAFLLLAVDLLLDHWPKSQESAWPFVASPELLMHDRNRYAQENLDQGTLLDAVGFGSLGESRKPPGPDKLKSLRSRPSRQASLDDLIGNYAVNGPAPLLAALQKQLMQAVQRLGPAEGDGGFGDPRFIAGHALNLSKLENWPEATLRRADGSEITAPRYRSPPDEQALLAPGQAASSAGLEDMYLRIALSNALGDRTKSSPELVEKGIVWARTESSHTADAEDAEWRTRSKLIAAALAMRDGSEAVRDVHVDWARGIFAQALNEPDDAMHRHREGLTFNPVAIATVGLISARRHRPASGDTRELLRIAARYEASMAHAFEAEAATINEIDPRLPISILRVAFAGQIRARSTYDDAAEVKSAKIDADRQRAESAVQNEIAWLDGSGAEPSWPVFPAYQLGSPRRNLRLPGGQGSALQKIPAKVTPPDQSVDHQGAALWLRKAMPLVNSASMPWLRILVNSYAAWTVAANGVGQAEEAESGRTPMEWNLAYFELVARTLVGMSTGEVDLYACNPICDLPAEPFFDVTTHFLRVVDVLHFNDQGVDLDTVLHIRGTLAQRLMESRGWRYVCQENSPSSEIHIAPAIAIFFMHDYTRISPTKCYLYPKGAARLDPFMPLVGELTVKAASSAFVATLFLGLVEVAVQPTHLKYLVASARAWQAKYPTDVAFWVDLGIGRRICNWLEEAMRIDPAAFLAAEAPVAELDKLLDHLVRHGVTSARAMEQVLEQLRK